MERVLENGVRQEWLDRVESRERDELLRRVDAYPGAKLELRGKTVLLVDDGLATGATMRAAVEAVRAAGASRVVAAAPVGSIEAENPVAGLRRPVPPPAGKVPGSGKFLPAF